MLKWVDLFSFTRNDEKYYKAICSFLSFLMMTADWSPLGKKFRGRIRMSLTTLEAPKALLSGHCLSLCLYGRRAPPMKYNRFFPGDRRERPDRWQLFKQSLNFYPAETDGLIIVNWQITNFSNVFWKGSGIGKPSVIRKDDILRISYILGWTTVLVVYNLDIRWTMNAIM